MESERLDQANTGATLLAQHVEDNDSDLLNTLHTDCMVEVEDRTWPGMNKQGGIARVKGVNATDRTVDVQYVLDNRKEKGISLDYVVLAPQYEVASRASSSSLVEPQQKQTSLRDRSTIKGRCHRCGSLRTDCNFCDWRYEELLLSGAASNTQQHIHKKEEDPILESSSDDDEFVDLMKQQRRKFRSLKQLQAKLDSEEKEHQQEQAKNNSQKEKDPLLESSDDDDAFGDLMQQQRKKFRRLKRLQSRLDSEEKQNRQQIAEEQARAIAESEKGNKHSQNKKAAPSKRSRISHNKDTNPDPFESSSDEDDAPLITFLNADRDHISRLKGKYGKSSVKRNAGNKRSRKEAKKKHDGTCKGNSTSNKSVLESLGDTPASTQKGAVRSATTSTGGDTPTAPENMVDISSVQSRSDDEDGATRQNAADENMSPFLTMDMGDDDNSMDDDDDHGQVDMDSQSEQESQNLLATAEDFGGQEDTLMGYDEDDDEMDARRNDLGLKEFIQPEGQEVAEHLPQDTKDRAADVPYAELPTFFDAESKHVEEELLLDAKLEVAKLERKVNEWEKQRASRTAPTHTANELLIMCASCEQFLKNKVIRDGIDQCKSALKQMLNEKRYKMELNKLPKPQRKALRSEREFKICSMDNKIEALDDEAEELIRKVRTAEDTLNRADDMDESVGSQDLSNSSDAQDDNENTALDSGSELEPAGALDNSDDNSNSYTIPTTRLLPPHDRHAHATRVRVRKPLSEAQTATTRKQRGTKRSTSNKRAKSQSTVGRSNSTTKRSGSSNARQNNASKKRRHDSIARNRYEPRRGHSTRTGSRTRLPQDPIEEQFSGSSSEGEDLEHQRREPRVSHRSRENRQAPPSRQRVFNKNIRAYLFSDRRGAGGLNNHSNIAVEEDREPVDPPQRRNQNHQNRGNRRRRQGLHDTDLDDQVQAPIRAPAVAGICWQDGQESATYEQSDAEALDSMPLYEATSCDNRGAYTSKGSSYLFSRLCDSDKTLTNESPPATRQQDPTPGTTRSQDLASICESVQALHPSDNQAAFAQKLNLMTSAAVQLHGEDGASRHSTAVLSFQTLLKLMQDQGSTLQEVLTRSGNFHHSYVSVLTATIYLIEKNKHVDLKPDDGLVYKVFSEGPKSGFIDAVVLQLVDSLYSVFHHTAWANPFQTRGTKSDLTILNALVPLRDALARVLVLPGNVCYCIAKSLERQTWRVVNTPEKHAFVSSVDPAKWRQLLQVGGKIVKDQDSRWSKFKDQLPRCEVEAFWQILAFVADSTSQSNASGEKRSELTFWLLSRFLKQGVLQAKTTKEAGRQNRDSLPPSTTQLEACQTEISYLSRLLTSGAISTLPKNDDDFKDIVTRAISLHSDAFTLDERMRGDALPTFRDSTTRADMKKIKRVWSSFDPESLSSQLSDALDPLVEDLLSQPILVASSSFVRQCMFLLFTWTRAVPVKKARINRLKSGIENLLKELVQKAEKYTSNDSRNGVAAEPDAFADAFSLGRGLTGWKGTYLRETAAYIHMVCAMAMSTRLDSIKREKANFIAVEEAASKVWSYLADDAMETRVRSIQNAADSVGSSRYQGDDYYRLYATGKAITFAALTTLGVQAWRGDDLNMDSFHPEPNDPNILVSLATRLIACLDCCCDMNGNDTRKAVMSSLSTCLAIFFSHACRLLTSKGSSEKVEALIPAIKNLGKVSSSIFERTFKRCFSILTENCSMGKETDICLRAMLSALRGAAFLTALVQNLNRSNSVESAMANDDDDADMWGGLNDEDIMGLVGDHPAQPLQNERSLVLFLSEALSQSKPSTRFAVQNLSNQMQPGQPDVLNLDAQGKSLVASYKHYICDCLVALAANANIEAARSLSSFLNRLRATPDDDDKPYHDEVSKLVCSSLCSMNSVLPCSSPEFSPFILDSLMDALLDSTALSKFPTETFFLRIEKAGRDLHDFAANQLLTLNERQGNARDVVNGRDPVWKFCNDCAGAVKATHSDYLIGSKLEEVLHFKDAPFTPEDLISLENECLKRLAAITCILKESTPSQERLRFRFMAQSSKQLLKLSKQNGFDEAAFANIDHASLPQRLDRANKIELFAVYAEMHMSLTCWILLQEVTSTHMESLHRCICNEYFPSLLHGNRNNVVQALQKIIKISSFGQQGVQQTTQVGFAETPGSYGNHQSLRVKMLRDCLLRRSRELFLYKSDNDGNDGLLLALVEAGSGKDESTTSSRTLARSLSMRQREIGKESQGFSEFQIAVDDFVALHMVNAGETEQDSSKRYALKHKFLANYVFPKLRLKPDMQAKKRILVLAQEVIEVDSGNTLFSILEENQEISFTTLQVVTRGLALAFKTALDTTTETVDNDFLSAIFSCSTAFAVSLVKSKEPRRRNVSEWSQQIAVDTALIDMNDATDEVLTAHYVWLTLLWLKHVAELVVVDEKESSSSDTPLQDLRTLLSEERDRWPLMPQEKEALLQKLTTHLFAEKERGSTRRIIPNMYAKTRKAGGSAGEAKRSDWIPDAVLRRKAKSYLAELIPLC